MDNEVANNFLKILSVFACLAVSTNETQASVFCRPDAMQGASYQDIATYLSSGDTPFCRNDTGETPLHLAKGVALAALALFERDGERLDPNARDSIGRTPLHMATTREEVEILVRVGANIEARNILGQSPLHIVASRNHISAAYMLLQLGASTDGRDADGNTPLHYASGSDMVVALIEAGAEINARNDSDMTPLHYAARWHYEGAIRALISMGASGSAIDTYGRTPFDILDQGCSRVPADTPCLYLGRIYWILNDLRYAKDQ